MLAAACWFALGIALAKNWQPTVVLLARVSLLTGMLIVAMRWSRRIVLLPLAALWAAAGFWCWQLRPVLETQPELTQYADGLSRNVRGRVVRVRELPPQEKAPDQDNDPAWWIEREPEAAAALSVDLSVEAVEEVTPDLSSMRPVEGGVRTIVMAQDAVLPVLRCGEVVEMPMRLRSPKRYHAPGTWQYADYLWKQGMSLHASEESYTNSGKPANNDSLVLRIEYGKASALLEGDAEAPTEQAMMAHGLTPVTLLNDGHHGSRTSTTPEFFAAVSPKGAVVSVGKGNTFGHPRFEVITRIAAGGTRLYRTDEFGLTTFLLDRDGTIREVLGEAN